MIVVRPNTIGDAELISCTIPETDHPAWSSGTTYALADKVIKAHKRWESLQAANANHEPETSPTWWRDLGPTNRWSMFDEKVWTTSSETNTFSVTVKPGRCDAIAMVNVNAATVAVDMVVASESVYSKTVSLIDSPSITDWYQYFFEPIKPQNYLVITDLPIYGDAEITVTFTASPGTPYVGVLVFGMQADLGGTVPGPSMGINDFSVKNTDAFGNTTLVRRAYSKRLGARLIFENTELDRVYDALADMRAVPAIWIGSDRYSSMVIYGFYRDFQVDITYPQISYCTINIEGLI